MTAPVPMRLLDAAQPVPPLAFEAVRGLAAVERDWRQLEEAGIGSPYQRFDWVRAYVDALAAEEGFEPWAVVGRDAAGEAHVLTALAVTRRRGLALAAPTGGKHANMHGPLLSRSYGEAGAPGLRAGLQRVARETLRADALVFRNVPATWGGRPNPFAEGGRPAASDLHGLALSGDGEAVLARALSKDTRKKLRKKEAALASLGPVRAVRAGTPEEAERFLGAFLALKAERMRGLGLPDPFASSAVRAFLRSAAVAGLDDGQAALQLHALLAGERICAVFGAAVDRERCAGMVIAFDPAPEAARSSPGDLLLTHVVRGEAAAGRKVFDLGVGEARYKSSLCAEVEPLVETVWPVTLRGRAYAAAAEGIVGAKRWVKRTPWAWELARKLRG